MKERTTLQITRPLLRKIRDAGRKGDTYADVIDRALAALREREFLDRQYETYLSMKAGKVPTVIFDPKELLR